MMEAGSLGDIEQLLIRIGSGEYLAQMFGGIPMSQGEIARPADLGLTAAATAARMTPAVEALIATGNTAPHRAQLAALMRDNQQATVGACGLDDTLDSIREEMRKFADDKVVPHAQDWHLNNEYIPLDVIGQMAELGVFGLTIPEDYGGLGLGKESMCVVSEELSRGYIGVGSLGTRSEIAAELILGSGTAQQKRHWLPKLASGDGAADRGVHRAQYRLRSRVAEDAGGARGRRLQGLRQQDLDHASGARRSDDIVGAYQPGRDRLSRALHAARREAAR